MDQYRARLVALLGALLLSFTVGATVSQASVLAAPSTTTPTPAAWGEAPPPYNYIYIETYYTNIVRTSLSACLDAGDSGVADGVYGDYYCWITAPGAITELHVTPF